LDWSSDGDETSNYILDSGSDTSDENWANGKLTLTAQGKLLLIKRRVEVDEGIASWSECFVSILMHLLLVTQLTTLNKGIESA
jgi:hypothetical protein